MPLPMVHLAIAVQLYQEQKKELSPEFLLGSLSPDAIHMRINWTQDDKSATHFGVPNTFPDQAQLQSLLDRNRNATQPLPAFSIGYIAHALTDYHWVDTVFRPRRHLIPTELSQEERRTLYYQETDQVDFNLYHRSPWRREIWKKLASAQAIDFPPILVAKEIDQWRQRTLRWFDELKEEPKIEPRYYTDTLVADFIDRAATVVGQKLEELSVLGWL